jgi:hypothetical protein
MATARLDILIRQARDATGNQTYSTTQGIPQREFVKLANHAQERIFNKMQQKRSSLFLKEGFLNATANTASVTLPTDIYLTHNVVSVEYSSTGNAQDYYPLNLRTPREQISVTGAPESYFLRNGSLIVSPKPPATVTNAFRLNYQFLLPDVDIRRAKISAFSSGVSLTLTDDSTLTTETAEDLANGWVDYCTVVDKDGTIKARDIAVTSYNSSTRVLATPKTLSAGESITAGSDYLVFGTYATTHSQVPKVCERYIYTYMKLFAQLRDSNTEALDTNPILKAIEEEILDGVEMLEEDISAIPILDYSFLNYADDYD